MLEVKELRIGNYVRDHYELYFTVLQLTGLTPKKETDCHGENIEFSVGFDRIHLHGGRDTTGWSNYLKHLHPIEINEHWLSLFGFSKTKVYVGAPNATEKTGWLKSSFFLYESGNGDLFFGYHGGNVQVEYVHQLQNLYFALTKKELVLPKEGLEVLSVPLPSPEE